MRQLIITGNQARAACKRMIDDAPIGYVFQLKEQTRTLAQNAKMWAMLGDISKQVIWHCNTLTPEEWKDVLTAGIKKQKVVPGVDGGFVVIGASTSKMNKSELADLVEFILWFGAEKNVEWSKYE